MVREVTLGLVQMSMSPNKDENLSKTIKLISDAAKKGAQIVCLPELFTTPYFPQQEKAEINFSEKIPGKTSKLLSKAAKDNKIVLVAGSIYEKHRGKFYNTSIVFDENGNLLGTYRKIHIPHDPSFYEQNYFQSGNDYKVFRTAYGNIGVLICYDQWYPEAARACALNGAEILFYPTAIGTVKGNNQQEGQWQDGWETVQRGHAIANCIVVAATNRVGIEGNMTFWGNSFISNAFGKILAKGGQGEEIVIVKVDLDHNKQVREGWRFFYNRHPKTYRSLTKNDK